MSWEKQMAVPAVDPAGTVAAAHNIINPEFGSHCAHPERENVADQTMQPPLKTYTHFY